MCLIFLKIKHPPSLSYVEDQRRNKNMGNMSNLEEDPYNDPLNGTWYSNYQGTSEEVFAPYWLQEEIYKYFGVARYSIPPVWWFGDQLQHDIAIGLSTDVSTKEEFELLAETLSLTRSGIRDEEGVELFEKVEAAADKYIKWVRKQYSQKLKRFYENTTLCVICEVSNRIKGYDVCVSCKREYAQEEKHIRIHLYRAKKAGTPATLTLGQWVNILKKHNYHCAYCIKGPYEVLEHFIPISSGEGGTTEGNCVPACRVCNSKKQDEHPER